MGKSKGKAAQSPPSRIDLRGLLEGYLLFKAANGVAERTLADSRYNVLRFLARFPGPFEGYQSLRQAVLAYFAQESGFYSSRLFCEVLRSLLRAGPSWWDDRVPLFAAEKGRPTDRFRFSRSLHA